MLRNSLVASVAREMNFLRKVTIGFWPRCLRIRLSNRWRAWYTLGEEWHLDFWPWASIASWRAELCNGYLLCVKVRFLAAAIACKFTGCCSKAKRDNCSNSRRVTLMLPARMSFPGGLVRLMFVRFRLGRLSPLWRVVILCFQTRYFHNTSEAFSNYVGKSKPWLPLRLFW